MSVPENRVIRVDVSLCGDDGEPAGEGITFFLDSNQWLFEWRRGDGAEYRWRAIASLDQSIRRVLPESGEWPPK